MRLREIQHIIENNIDVIHKFSTIKSKPNTHMSIEGYNDFMRSIRNLEKTDLFSSDIEDLVKEELYLITKYPNIRFSSENVVQLTKIANNIYNKCLGMINLIDNAFHETKENSDSLVVSLPNRKITTKEFENIIVEFNSLLKLLSIHPEFKQQDLEVENLDIGSEWLVIALQSAAALGFFGSIINMTLIISQNIKSNKILDKQLESIELDEDLKASYKKASQKINIQVYESGAKRIIEESDVEDIPENISQLASALAKANELISLGVSFDSSINASKEISEHFPKLIEQQSKSLFNQLESLKLIENNQSDKSESGLSE